MNVGTTMRFTIKLKLASTFAVIIVLAGAMAWFGISSLGSLNTTMGDLLQGPVQRALIEHQLENDMLQILRAEKNMLLADTPNEIAKYDAEELAARSQFVARLDKVVAIGTTEGRKRIAVLNAHRQARRGQSAAHGAGAPADDRDRQGPDRGDRSQQSIHAGDPTPGRGAVRHDAQYAADRGCSRSVDRRCRRH